MKAIYLTSHFSKLEELSLTWTERPTPKPKKGECLVRVASSGVNPSDVLGALGYFSHAKLPRIPGRDFAGTVIEGNPQWVGKKVWGTGGSAGIDFDGTHAEFISIPESALVEIPRNLSLLEAGAQPLPYVTAYYSLISRGKIEAGEKVLVIGALGQVGSAAMSICKWKGCHPVGLVRTPEDVKKAHSLKWTAFDSIPSGMTFDVILNSIGNLQWSELLKTLNKFGRMVVIAAKEGEREVEINLLNLYRANQGILGINSVDLDFTASGKILELVKRGFESNHLTPIDSSTTLPLEKAEIAYKMVLSGSGGKRVVLLT